MSPDKVFKKIIQPGGLGPPVLYEPPTKRDVQILRRQAQGRKHDGKAILGIVRRCPWQAPQVVLCAPLVRSRPFPTSLWLSCPFLGQVCSRLEALGGVGRLEGVLEAQSESAWRAFHLEHLRLRLSLLSSVQRRFLSLYEQSYWKALRKGGIGGVSLKGRLSVKCLHLQVASWLGWGFHPAELWLQGQVTPLFCPEGRCLAFKGENEKEG